MFSLIFLGSLVFIFFLSSSTNQYINVSIDESISEWKKQTNYGLSLQFQEHTRSRPLGRVLDRRNLDSCWPASDASFYRTKENTHTIQQSIILHMFFFFFFSFAYVLCFRQREEKDARKTKEVLSQTEKFDSTHSVLMNFVPVYSRGNAMNHESKDKEKLQLDSPIAIHNRQW